MVVLKSLRHHSPVEHHLLARVPVRALMDSLCPHPPRPDILPVLQVAASLKVDPLVGCSRDVQLPAVRRELRQDVEPRRSERIELVRPNVPRHLAVTVAVNETGVAEDVGGAVICPTT